MVYRHFVPKTIIAQLLECGRVDGHASTSNSGSVENNVQYCVIVMGSRTPRSLECGTDMCVQHSGEWSNGQLLASTYRSVVNRSQISYGAR